MKYANPHETALLIPEHTLKNEKGYYPSIILAAPGTYTYEDGSGGSEPIRWAVNTAPDPYALQKGILRQTSQSISLMMGLYLTAPEMYRALNDLLNNKEGARERAKKIMEKAVNQEWDGS